MHSDPQSDISSAYSGEGARAKLLLLHGFCESPQIFSSLLSGLESAYEVFCPVLPGHGGLAWDYGLDRISDWADWVLAWMDEVGLDRCWLAGHSLGGYIAAALVARAPERFSGLCMIHSTALADPPERRLQREKTLRSIERFGPGPFLKAFLESLFCQDVAAWKTELREITAQVDPGVIPVLIRAMRDRPNRRSDLQAFPGRVCYLIGEEDGLVSPARSAVEFEGWDNVEVKRLAGVGHMAMYEAPQDLVELLLGMLDWAVAK